MFIHHIFLHVYQLYIIVNGHMLGVLALQDNKVQLDKVAVRRCLALQHGRSALRHHHPGTGLFTRCAHLCSRIQS